MTRIIDYKTGTVTLATAALLKKPIYEYMDAYFTNPKLKSGFQGYFYGLLTKKELIKDFQVGILGMRELGKGVQWLQNGGTISSALMDEFETRLQSLVHEIYNPQIDFIQTEDSKNCEYCPYNRICHKV